MDPPDMLETLDKVLMQYTGRGQSTKGTAVFVKNLKVGYTGICSIDAFINLMRPSEIQSAENHGLCSHKERCALCIMRSAILRIMKNKEKKMYVKMQEIQNNMHIFLGPHYCDQCYQPVQDEDHIISHNCPVLKPADIPIKFIVDNFLEQANLTKAFLMDITCEECLHSASPFKEGYFKVEKSIEEKNSQLSVRIEEMVKNIKSYHHRNSPACKSSEIKLENLPNNLLVMMEPKAVTTFEPILYIGSLSYGYAGQLDFNTGTPSNSFSAISLAINGRYVEYSGQECKQVNIPNVSKSVLMLYTQTLTLAPTRDFIYKAYSIQFFSNWTKEYYTLNKESLKRRSAEQYSTNPEKKRAAAKKYSAKQYAINPEKKKAASRKFSAEQYAVNPEKKKAASKKFSAKQYAINSEENQASRHNFEVNEEFKNFSAEQCTINPEEKRASQELSALDDIHTTYSCTGCKDKFECRTDMEEHIFNEHVTHFMSNLPRPSNKSIIKSTIIPPDPTLVPAHLPSTTKESLPKITKLKLPSGQLVWAQAITSGPCQGIKKAQIQFKVIGPVAPNQVSSAINVNTNNLHAPTVAFAVPTRGQASSTTMHPYRPIVPRVTIPAVLAPTLFNFTPISVAQSPQKTRDPSEDAGVDPLANDTDSRRSTQTVFMDIKEEGIKGEVIVEVDIKEEVMEEVDIKEEAIMDISSLCHAHIRIYQTLLSHHNPLFRRP